MNMIDFDLNEFDNNVEYSFHKELYLDFFKLLSIQELADIIISENNLYYRNNNYDNYDYYYEFLLHSITYLPLSLIECHELLFNYNIPESLFLIPYLPVRDLELFKKLIDYDFTSLYVCQSLKEEEIPIIINFLNQNPSLITITRSSQWFCDLLMRSDISIQYLYYFYKKLDPIEANLLKNHKNWKTLAINILDSIKN